MSSPVLKKRSKAEPVLAGFVLLATLAYVVASPILPCCPLDEAVITVAGYSIAVRFL